MKDLCNQSYNNNLIMWYQPTCCLSPIFLSSLGRSFRSFLECPSSHDNGMIISVGWL